MGLLCGGAATALHREIPGRALRGRIKTASVSKIPPRVDGFVGASYQRILREVPVSGCCGTIPWPSAG